MTQAKLSAGSWAAMVALALIWGGSFVSTHAALEELGVLTTLAFRVGLAGLALWLWIAFRRLEVPRDRQFILNSLFLGVVNIVMPFFLIIWGQTHIPSGLAGILNASNAIFSVALAALFFPDEKLTPTRALGVTIGFAGVALTVGPGLIAKMDLTSLGQLAVLGASLCYALGAIYSRRNLRGVRPEVVAAGMLSVAAVIVLPLSLAVEGVPSFDYRWPTWAGVLYISLLSSAFAYFLFYRVLQRAGAGNVSLVTLMIAPVAVTLGALIYDETLAPHAYLGMGLIAAGMVVMDGRIRGIFRVKRG